MAGFFDGKKMSIGPRKYEVWYSIILEVPEPVSDDADDGIDFGREMAISLPGDYRLGDLYDEEDMRQALTSARLLERIGVAKFANRKWWA